MSTLPEERVVIAIDVENLLLSAPQKGRRFHGYSVVAGFINLFDWAETIGVIERVDFYLPPKQGVWLNQVWHDLSESCNSRFHTDFHVCPVTKVEGVAGTRDNVDKHLEYHTRHIMENLGNKVTHFILGSGDIDYSGLLWWLKQERGMQIGFALGSELSFSRVYKEMHIISSHPRSAEELIHYFNPCRKNIS